MNQIWYEKASTNALDYGACQYNIEEKNLYGSTYILLAIH